ncbi:MAG TPA: glycoside hydrolase family 97 protein [Acidobacteriaceae bacterium]|jgi:alpha-glucosidase|nr:glycoside hydrolase family 97 protein [Acidobacteriaceae bacterium]
MPLRIISSPALKTALFLAMFTAPMLAQNLSASVASPDHKLLLRFDVVQEGRPTGDTGRLVYSLSFQGRPLLVDSGLSLSLAGAPPLGDNVRMNAATPGSGVDDYDEVAGKTSHVHDPWNSVTVRLTDAGDSGSGLIIEARAYDTGVAFRYVLPEESGHRHFELQDEHTEFNFVRDASTWALVLPNFRSAFESEYLPLHVSAFGTQGGEPAKTLVGLPLLTHSPGVGWLAITEADLEGDAVLYLTNNRSRELPGEGRFRLESTLAPRFTDIPSYPAVAVVGSAPWHSAWHVLQVAENPADLINANLLDDLNSPSRIEDAHWIQAGKAAWDWWGGNIGADGKPANSTEMVKHYVDFAAGSGFRYMLIDAGWSKSDDITEMNGHIDVPGVVRYAASRGVKIWLWTDFAATARQMEQAFPLYEKWGVAGVKIDFIQRSDQPAIDFYYRAAQLAAEHHLMLDFHGSTTPWGISRTWPNVMAYEAVMGAEYSKWSDRDDPVHRATLPFTRMLDGAMDYTPGGFGNATAAQFVPRDIRPMVQGTRAQQLALYVIDFDPFQMVSDAPQAYAGQPAFQFIRDVPASWDETRALQGFPSETVTIARRKGQDWYVGSITNWTPRTITLPLSFLGDGSYAGQMYEDAKDADQNPQHVSIETTTVTRHDTLTLHLAAGGGCALRFVPRD